MATSHRNKPWSQLAAPRCFQQTFCLSAKSPALPCMMCNILSMIISYLVIFIKWNLEIQTLCQIQYGLLPLLVHNTKQSLICLILQGLRAQATIGNSLAYLLMSDHSSAVQTDMCDWCYAANFLSAIPTPVLVFTSDNTHDTTEQVKLIECVHQGKPVLKKYALSGQTTKTSPTYNRVECLRIHAALLPMSFQESPAWRSV